MAELIFITGGARSGKSKFAENLLTAYEEVLYIATAIAYDTEMTERIRQHRISRNPRWLTVEAFQGVGEKIKPYVNQKRAILLDCLTLMITNLMINDQTIQGEQIDLAKANQTELYIESEIDQMLAVMQNHPGPVIIVSNEVGMGLVPEYPLGRCFRDIAGRMNQKLAQCAEKVYFLVSGIPMQIKG